MASIGDRESEIEDEVFEETVQCKVQLPDVSVFLEDKTLNISPHRGQDEQPLDTTHFSDYDELSPKTTQNDYTPQTSPIFPHASFCRHRSSLSKKGVKELKHKVSECKSEIKRLNKKLGEAEMVTAHFVKLIFAYIFWASEIKTIWGRGTFGKRTMVGG